MKEICLFCLRIAALTSSDHSFCSLFKTSPQLHPKLVLHRLRSSDSSFCFQYPVFSLRPPSNFVRLLPRLLVTSILPSTFPSITLVTYIRINFTSVLQTKFTAPEISSQCVFSFSSYKVHVLRVSRADFRSYSNRTNNLYSAVIARTCSSYSEGLTVEVTRIQVRS